MDIKVSIKDLSLRSTLHNKLEACIAQEIKRLNENKDYVFCSVFLWVH